MLGFWGSAESVNISFLTINQILFGRSTYSSRKFVSLITMLLIRSNIRCYYVGLEGRYKVFLKG